MVGREIVFEYSVFPTSPYDGDEVHPPWHLRGCVVDKQFWQTPEGTQGYYRIHRTVEDDVVILPLGVIRAMWSV